MGNLFIRGFFFSMGISYYTKEGLDKLRSELNHLKDVERPNASKAIAEARDKGDLSENAERFPRVFLTRKLIKDGSEYYGPYTNIKVINVLLNIIRTLYPIRNGNYNFSERQIKNSKKELFLKVFKKNEHSIIIGFHESGDKKVSESLLSENIYDQNIVLVREILNGKFKKVKKLLREEMYTHSNDMNFERAQNIKEKIEALENYQSRSTVVSKKLNNIDVFSIISDSENAYINYLQIAYGRVIRFHNQEIKKTLDEDDVDVLSLVIFNLRDKFKSESKTIISQYNLTKQLNVKFIVPKAGDNKKLLELSLKNCKIFKLERLKQIQILDPERHKNRIMNQMKVDLKLKNEPNHIECFDISNIQGTNTVAACVVFIDGKPMKKMYRKFIIKTVSGPNDYKSMEEVIYRRYSRMLNEKLDLPKLIVIDGGKGQLSSVDSLFKLSSCCSEPSNDNTLSFNSKITLCEVFRPIPLIDCITCTFSVIIAETISLGVNDDSIILPVLAPTPETEINNLKRLRSDLSKKP